MDKKDHLEGLLTEAGYSDIDVENRMMVKVVDRGIQFLTGRRVLCLGYSGDAWPGKLRERLPGRYR
jgi:hypothetical protein